MIVFTHKNEDSHYITDGMGFCIEITPSVVDNLLVKCFENYASSMLTWREMKTRRGFKLFVNRLLQDEWQNGKMPTAHERNVVFWAIVALDSMEFNGHKFDWQNADFKTLLLAAQHRRVRARVQEIRLQELRDSNDALLRVLAE